MIRSKEDYLHYLNADRIALGKAKKTNLTQRVKDFFFPDYVWVFQKTLRKLEYLANTRSGWVGKIEKFFVLRKFRRLSYKLGFSIPINVFGPGLSIAHYGTIVVNPSARVGANCRLHIGVSIGGGAGTSGSRTVLGNNCYVGPGSVFYGHIELADNIVIGANSVVNKSFLESGVVIAGAPARKIGEIRNIHEIVTPASELALINLNTDIFSGKPASEINAIILEKNIVLKKSASSANLQKKIQ